MPDVKVELAKSGRSKCTNTKCKELIEKGEIRIGSGSVMPDMEEPTYKWRHVCCFTKIQIKNINGEKDQVKGYEDMSKEDQKTLDLMLRGELVDNQSIRGATGELRSGGGKKPAGKKAAPKKATKRKNKDDESEEEPKKKAKKPANTK